ncbi:hypothetical protein QE152_g29592 [Popillia japonica]|uniref:Uncharacterized protein n=1 Tax=Popillia japonica TaxID=7064 RepID=A0AAW1JGG9_POPJA
MNNLQRNKVNKLIKLIVTAILEEVDEEICVINKKKLWVRKWIDRRDKLGATNCLLKELALEDPKEYFRRDKLGATNCLLKELALEDPKEYFDTLRMSESCVNFLLMKIHSQIQRKDTLNVRKLCKFSANENTLSNSA